MNNKKVLILFTILVCVVGTKAFAYDFAVENADGITIYYYTNGGKELEVTYLNNNFTSLNYTGSYSGVVVIPEEVTYMNRTRKVTRIGSYAFYQCFDLTNVIMPSSVTSIGSEAFRGCYNLTSIDIPNSVTEIGNSAFSGCRGLTSVIIPNSVTSIGDSAFRDCSSLTSVTIPNSVTKIGSYAFFGCSSLTSVTIGNSVTSIGNDAFVNPSLSTVISKIENPFNIPQNTFSNNTFLNATLYIPVGTIDKYKKTAGWKNFLFIEEGDGSGNTPTDTKKCEKPTISYKNGLLTYHCATEDAICQSTISDTDIKSYSSNEVLLSVTYEISVYATKEGYENSETATATLCWIDVEPKTEGIENGIAQVRANAVLIQSESGLINITGTNDGTKIYVYGIDGQLVGSSMSYDGQTSINTNLQSGSIAIVNIGDKNVKIVMK